MAASELIEEEAVRIPVEANVTSSSSPTRTHPQRAGNGNPARHASTPSPPAGDRDGTDGRERGGLCGLRLIESLNSKLKRRCDYEKICAKGERADSLPNEWWKTGVAFLYAFFNLVFTTVVITIVHERVPDKSVSPPLPDKFFDYVDRVPWAFTITETNGLILVGLWLIQWLFLKHKAIVGRRCFFLIGTLYMYRCITMYITTLPVPGEHMVCAPKLYNDSTGKIWRILRLISGGGLSLTGSHLMCGDFLYSGHTVMLTLSYLFISEYSPRWMWWYRWFCWVLSASGVICILVGHEHYSIDVVIAYYVTTRIFWWYHTMANTHELRGAPNSYLSRVWWNPVFRFLERNVQTTVPVVFLSPRALLSSCKERYQTMGAERDE
ncbi:phosphatidylcholine:ceramide cholinephosphotransferase 2 isoform 2-T2 [Anableps anableps]